MLRAGKLSFLLLLFLALSYPALSVADKNGTLGSAQDRAVEMLVTAIIDRALEPGTSPAAKDSLIKEAKGFADTYSMLKGDISFQRKIKDYIHDAARTSIRHDEALVREFQQEAGKKGVLRPFTTKYRQRVLDFINGLIERTIDQDISPDERGLLLDTAVRSAKVYAGYSDDEILLRNIEYTILSLPSSGISGDDDIVREFQNAMLHDNRLAMKYLAKKVGDRIEPFVNGIIGRALEPEKTAAEKEMLLMTAMNFAKTFGDMTQDHSFHRRIHQQAFTARLTAPFLSVTEGGVHIIEVPKSSGHMDKNVFRPDNIIIRAGETVRWVNHDDTTHVIGSFDFISDGHFFAPSIGLDGSFEHKFVLPGEYYYICYIHNSMIGKITVVE